MFETYDQWHSDGLEFEVNSIAPGAVCQGTYKTMGNGTVHLYHVIYTYDGSGVFNGRILETETNTVGADGKTYQGTFDQKFYDLSGNFLFEATGTLTATRITPRKADPRRARPVTPAVEETWSNRREACAPSKRLPVY